jgi:hypothetical protein
MVPECLSGSFGQQQDLTGNRSETSGPDPQLSYSKSMPASLPERQLQCQCHKHKENAKFLQNTSMSSVLAVSIPATSSNLTRRFLKSRP